MEGAEKVDINLSSSESEAAQKPQKMKVKELDLLGINEPPQRLEYEESKTDAIDKLFGGGDVDFPDDLLSDRQDAAIPNRPHTQQTKKTHFEEEQKVQPSSLIDEPQQT